MAETIGTAYVQIEPSFDGVVPKIDKEFGGAGKESGNSFVSGFGSVMGTVGKVVAGATAAATTAVGGMVKSAVSAYSEFEQLEGGAKLLFGSAYDTVIQNAEKAFGTVQMSTNDYLASVNSYATGLKTSLNNDEQAAADLADKIITAQADVVAATGESQESIANAFSGIMKNNFQMLDNLKIGIKPTKEGMQEVIDLMNKENAAHGNKTKYQMGNLADMEAALVDYVKYVGMAGYAQAEGADTIQGALASTKAAWDNLITSLGTGDTSKITENINNLVKTAGQLGTQVMPIIEQALGGIAQLIQELGPQIATALPGLITEILPGLLDAGVSIIESLGQGILSAIPQLMPTITSVVIQLSQLLITMLPQLLTVGIQILKSLCDGIIQALPELIPTLTQVVLELVNILTDPGNIQMLISAALDLILALADGLLQAIPDLIAAIPQVITAIISALVNADTINQLVQAGLSLIEAIVTNLPTIIQAMVDAIPLVIQGLATALTDPQCITALIMGFIQLVAALAAAFPQIWMACFQAIPQIIDGIVQGFEALGPALIACFSEVITNLNPVFMQIGQFAQKAWTAIQQAFAGVGAWFRTKFTEAVNAIKAVFNTVGQYFKEKYNEIVNIFANVKEKFSSVGRNIVEGIKNGIASSWKAFYNYLEGLFEELLEFIKDLLGIHSPSKLFRDEIGQWIPAGIGVGIEKGMDSLKQKAAAMKDELLDGTLITNAQVLSSTKFEPDTSSMASQSVVINNNIKVDGAADPEAWTQTFIRSLKREARMA